MINLLYGILILITELTYPTLSYKLLMVSSIEIITLSLLTHSLLQLVSLAIDFLYAYEDPYKYTLLRTNGTITHLLGV